MGLLAHLVVLFSIFWGISILFSIVVAPFYIPTNHVQGFWFLNILANQVFWYSFIVVLVWNVYNFSWAQNVIYISLIADDFDHVFRSLLAFEASSSPNWLLIPCYHISNGAAVCFFCYWFAWLYSIFWLSVSLCAYLSNEECPSVASPASRCSQGVSETEDDRVTWDRINGGDPVCYIHMTPRATGIMLSLSLSPSSLH